MKHRLRGIANEAIMEPREMKSHSMTVMIKRIMQISALSGARARKTPKPVATPFPPLNLKKIEKIWPTTAHKPVRTAIAMSCEKNINATWTGMKPLTQSRARVAAPYFNPKILAMFAAPMLPLPS